MKKIFTKVFYAFAAITFLAGALPAGAQVPTVSYSGPQTYVVGKAITPLSPTSSGTTAPGYNTGTTTLGSGFDDPAAIAVDAAGNIYVSDIYNGTIKKIPGGTGTPVVVGTGFYRPLAMAIDVTGNIYVADQGYEGIFKIPADGGPRVFIDERGFPDPAGVAVDKLGNVYVAYFGETAIKMIPVGGGAMVSVGSGFVHPWGVAVDAYGNLYVADNSNKAIKKVPVGGGAPVTLGSGFTNPYAVAIDGSGNVFVADASNKLVKEIAVNGGPIITVGSGYNAFFGVTTDAANNVYVTDRDNKAVKKIKPIGGYYINPALPAGLIFNNTTGTISGTPAMRSPATNYTITAYNSFGGTSAIVNITVNPATFSYGGPKVYTAGTAISPLIPTSAGNPAAAPAYSTTATKLGQGINDPTGIAVDSVGNIYISDSYNGVVKKIPRGTGTPVVVGPASSIPPFSYPNGVAIDAAGNVYVADSGHKLVKKIPADGSPIVSIGGTDFSGPGGVAVDKLGNVYVTDNYTIKMIPVGGGPTVTIGSGFKLPYGVAVDAYGNIYVADGASALTMIPVGSGAPITLGSGIEGSASVAVDGSGNVFVADIGNNQVKEIRAAGGATVIVGSGYSQIRGVATDATNNVYVTDIGDYVVKKITPTGGYYINPALPAGLRFNCTTGTITGTPTMGSPATNYKITAYYNLDSTSTTVNIAINGATFSYPHPYIYTAGTAISPLTPTGTGVAAPGYSSTTATLGSGFSAPSGIAVDAAGNIYIGDKNNNALKKIPGGTGTPVVVGSGFSAPEGVAIDAAGNLYVADNGHNLVKKIPANGSPIISIGGPGFSNPGGVAVDKWGNVYVADAGNNAVKMVPVGGGPGVAIGSGFANPTGVAVDAYGNVYVADNGNNAIKKIPVGGGAPVTLGSGFANPTTVAVDGSGNVFVADQGNNQVKEIPVGGGLITTVGSGYNAIFGVTTDAANNVYVTDPGNNAVDKIKPTGGYYINPALPAGLSFNCTTGTISGTPAMGSPSTNYLLTAYNNSGSGSVVINIIVNAAAFSYPNYYSITTGTSFPLTPISIGNPIAAPGYSSSTTALGSGFNKPTGIAVDTAGNVYIGDKNHNVVKKIPGGTGTPVVVGTGFSNPEGVAIDAAGNLYVADNGNNLVKKISADGSPIISIGGPGFSHPFGVAVDKLGNVYVADWGNNAVKMIPAGGGPTVAIGSGFASPTGVAVDEYGNVYVADYGNNAIKIIPVGGGAPVTLGSGFTNPYTVAVDDSGNVFVADSGHNQMKEIPVGGGPITTVGSGYNAVFGVTTDAANNVYVTDFGNNTVNKIVPTGGYYIHHALPAGLSFNCTTGTISGTPTMGSPATNYTVIGYNSFGSASALVNIIVKKSAFLTTLKVRPVTALTSVNGTDYKDFTTTVPNTETEVKIVPTTQDAGATIKVNGVTVASGAASAAISLNVGDNVVNTVVTAIDGVSVKKYSIKFTRLPSTHNALLTTLKLNPVTAMTVVSGADYKDFTTTVPNSETSVKITPMAQDPLATIKVNGVTVANGASSAPIALNVGTNVINTVVTAQDGITQKTYSITLTRLTLTNANLSDFAISPGTLTPAFATGIINYNTSVLYSTTQMTVTPTASDASATITVNGVAVISGTASGDINLNVGPNIISTVVTAPDGVTQKTYTLTVTRPTNNALLSTLKISPVTTLTLVSGADYKDYTTTVPNSEDSVKITPTAQDPSVIIKVNGIIVASGESSAAIALNVGTNVINTVVTTQDGTATKTYGITFTRQAAGMVMKYEPQEQPITTDNITVHQNVSPNGDGNSDVLVIDGITAFPDNKLQIMNRSGELVYQVKGYDNINKAFDGQSNINGKLQQAGTYFYSLEYKDGNEVKRKTGFIVLKY